VKTKISHIPTNIITGFLGTGKTSTIQHILNFKPKHERWAVLVNEFGTIGIDAALYQNDHDEDGGVFISEVPGGCMCCVSGLPMQIALNVLLKKANPHRLLIEPTGLGHPVEVISLLMSQYYRDVLDIQQVLTVVDPLHVLQERYFNHETFQQQLQIADTWILNKIDQLSPAELSDSISKLKLLGKPPNPTVQTEYGRVDPDILLGQTHFDPNLQVPIRQTEDLDEALPDLPEIPLEPGWLKSSRTDEGYHGISWRYLKSQIFDRSKLIDWLQTLDAERIKGVFMTEQGVIGLNGLNGQIQTIDFADCHETKLEIICHEVDPHWDSDLSSCLMEPVVSTPKQVVAGN